MFINNLTDDQPGKDYASPTKKARIKQILNNKCTRVGFMNRENYKDRILHIMSFCNTYVIDKLGPRIIDDIINYFTVCLNIDPKFLQLCGDYPEDCLCIILNDAMEHYKKLKYPPNNIEDYLKRNIHKFIRSYFESYER